MIDIAPCRRHGRQRFVSTSAKIADAAANDRAMTHEGIQILTIVSYGKSIDHHVDQEFLASFGVAPSSGHVTLHDRVKDDQNMNDRLLLQRVLKEMGLVCPVCLADWLKAGVDDGTHLV